MTAVVRCLGAVWCQVSGFGTGGGGDSLPCPVLKPAGTIGMGRVERGGHAGQQPDPQEGRCLEE